MGCVGVAFYLLGLCGFLMGVAQIGDQVYLIWPPTGLALFAFLSWGWPIWPAIFLPSLLLGLANGSTPLASMLVASGNVAGPMLSAALMNRVAFDKRWHKLRDYLLFACPGCTVSAIISACIGTFSLLVSHVVRPEALGVTWVNWWVGDFLGGLLIGPTLISLFPPSISEK